MGATKIMVIRHAEKPGAYGNQSYGGVNALGAADSESLVTLGWERYADAIIGIDHFGASAPYQRIFAEFGITAGAIAATLEAELE